jgi:hypothetical protein
MPLVRVRIVLALQTKYVGGLAASPVPQKHDAVHDVRVAPY